MNCPNASACGWTWRWTRSRDPDGYLEHGEIIQVGDEELEVRFTPGHAPGHVVFVHHAGKQVFAGDTLFQGSIGRFDLPGADGLTLLAQHSRPALHVARRLCRLSRATAPATTIGDERRSNPYVGVHAEAGRA